MSILRREFCGAVGAILATANTNLTADESMRKPLRVIAYNIFGLTGWPHQRNLAKRAVAEGQMAKRLAMELALYDPDIINFSESPKRGTDQRNCRASGYESRPISEWWKLAGDAAE